MENGSVWLIKTDGTAVMYPFRGYDDAKALIDCKIGAIVSPPEAYGFRKPYCFVIDNSYKYDENTNKLVSSLCGFPVYGDAVLCGKTIGDDGTELCGI